MATTMKISALFSKKGTKAPATKTVKPGTTVKKAAPATKPAGGRRTKGWLGEQDGTPLNLDKWYGPSRALYLPGGLLDPSEVPAYLNGELPGDYGYDPLSLSADGSLETKRAYELIHARWAMLFTAGAIIPEGLAANGADIKAATWFETPFELAAGNSLTYFPVPFPLFENPLPLVAIAAINTVLMGAVETFRQRGEGPAGYSPGFGKFDSGVFDGLDSLYPGGPFDPLGLADDPEVFQELKIKEIKNGRLAMFAMFGFFVQAIVTGKGPLENLSDHLTDPISNNGFAMATATKFVPS